MPEAESNAIELAPLREMLRMYCHALSERNIELQDLAQLVEKNIGWTRTDIATSDGTAIFLPSIVERFDGSAENFEFLKVMLTQQAGHLEFGSFDFEFKRPSKHFDDLRPKLAKAVKHEHVDDHGHHHTHDHEHDDDSSLPELSRFFDLFPNKRLALDIFSVVESSRIEAVVMRAYRGIAPIYGILRQRTLALRQELTLLPARESLIEMAIRFSLGHVGAIKVPTKHVGTASEIAQLLNCAIAQGATIEDSAEATLRLYHSLAQVHNEFLEADQFVAIELTSKMAPRYVPSELLGVTEASLSVFPSKPEGLYRGGKSARGPAKAEQLLIRHFASQAQPVGRNQDYLAPQGVDYRGEFKPELAQLLTKPQSNAREQRKALTPEELSDLLKNQNRPQNRNQDSNDDDQDPQTAQMVQNLMRELERRDPRMQSIEKRPWFQNDDDAGPLSATQPNTFIYDEWDVFRAAYRSSWCKVYEKTMGIADLKFYRDTLLANAGLLQQIRREFELVAPEMYLKEKRLPDGNDHDLDAAIEAMTDLRIGVTPSEKIFWRHHKTERDVAVAFLLDMSGSTGEAISTTIEPMQQGGRVERSHRRIIDVEKEAIVLMIDALEALGDRYGVYGFSGHGRDNVEYYVIKDFDEEFSQDVAKRTGRVGPLHATRMGPAIRHTVAKLRAQQTRSRFLFLLSDGRPQDRGYSQESSEKGYAIQDTRMAFTEARREGITPFCLTVDKEGNDYMRAMMDDFGYEVLAEVAMLPLRLPQLYRKLTM
ncbi:MAG: VWA domain-containing protein [Deltaproteobacteria bacterium]|nr:VWA domain-containing protein [Deltaproteobacteria bacterium]